MKLSEAIELGKLLLKQGRGALHPESLNALQVLIEAGKSVQHSRIIFPDVKVGLLPGETKD